jgi:hypothetical protein
MTDLDRRLRPLIDQPAREPATLEDIERRASRRRTERWATGAAATLVVAAGVGVALQMASTGPSIDPIAPAPATSPSPAATTTPSPSPTPTPSPEPEPAATPDSGPAGPDARSSGWYSDRQKAAWQADNGDGTWVVGFVAPQTDDGPATADDLVRLWYLEDERATDLTPEELLALALARLPGPVPGYQAVLGGEPLADEVRIDGDEVHVTSSAAALEADPGLPPPVVEIREAQVLTTIAHIARPTGATTVCIDVGSGQVWLDGRPSCPIELP